MMHEYRCGLTLFMLLLFYSNSAISDNVEELIELFRINEESAAQYQECLQNAANTIESTLTTELLEGDIDIQPDSEDWTLLIAIYIEYYNSLCGYLSGDEILNFYRSEFRKRFTPEEIDRLIEFHKTPLGSKLNEEWFAINRKFSEIVHERQSLDEIEAGEKFDRRMEEFWEYRERRQNDKSGDQDV